MKDTPRVHAETVEDWRAWLAENHDSSTGVWLVSWKRSTGRPTVGYEPAVEEALAVGWIDSTARTVDDERSMQRFTPRRKGSGWSRSNKERIARLEADGRMTDAGRTVVEAAKVDESWSLLDDVEDLVVPDDLTEGFARHAGSREQWDGFPPSARRMLLAWIVQAKRPETRAKRIEEVAARAAKGERANQA